MRSEVGPRDRSAWNTCADLGTGYAPGVGDTTTAWLRRIECDACGLTERVEPPTEPTACWAVFRFEILDLPGAALPGGPSLPCFESLVLCESCINRVSANLSPMASRARASGTDEGRS